MQRVRVLICSVTAVLVVLLAGTWVHTASAQEIVQPREDDAEASGATPVPLVVRAPGDVEISIEIRPTHNTQELLVYADSGSYYRSTTIGLNGEHSEPIHSFTWRAFPVGDYEVVGMLVDTDGTNEVVVRGALRVVDR